MLIMHACRMHVDIIELKSLIVIIIMFKFIFNIF